MLRWLLDADERRDVNTWIDGMDAAIETPDRTRRASFVQRLARRAGDAPLAACVGIDPSSDALALLEGIGPFAKTRDGRIGRAGAIERFAGLVIESARDHAVAVKPQVAWFEAAGAPGMRALERTVEFARTAGLLVVLDAKRGDVPHSAAAYADAWIGDLASAGHGVDALTVNATVGRDSVDAMARIAADRSCALYALLHTSNPGAATLQGAPLEGGEPWWQLLARELAGSDADVGGGIVGAVVGGTRPELLAEARGLLPAAPLLVPGIGAQGGTIEGLAQLVARSAGAPTTLVVAARSLLPTEPCSTPAFRHAVDSAASRLAADLARVGAHEPVL
ncbi:MAG: orotidine 5-phosphate decarboxylase [Thermoleophilia bacterium]|nr:orotidine 5-phosphate decarboxylase [Thermoleophilia bacterium]